MNTLLVNRKIFKWISICILSLVFLLVLTGFIYEQVARYTIEIKFPVRGRLVEVDGHKLNIRSLGNGKPIVVFESGLDIGGSLVWNKVQLEVAKFATAVSYDRSGVLWSERGQNPKTCHAMAEELYQLLKNSGHKGPYILVGHSMAGYMLRSFVKNHPTEVAAIIFVDVSHPDQLNRFPKEIRRMMATPPEWITDLKSSIGITRWLALPERYPATLENDSINLMTNAYMPRSIPAVMEELANFENMGVEAGKIDSFRSTPLIVITGTGEQRMSEFTNMKLGTEFIKSWMKMQTELLSLSSNSKQILADKSGHYVQLEQPELVVKVIRNVIAQSKATKNDSDD
ncbi:MAG: alpha/beta hydrolase [Cyclobacteriaceae bacterium]